MKKLPNRLTKRYKQYKDDLTGQIKSLDKNKRANLFIKGEKLYYVESYGMGGIHHEVIQ